jgi:polar amino acid transport system ATP-binding protein
LSAAAPILEVRGLHKSFGALEVLKGVDLAVQKGEMVFVIGPSGSGKSTLLRCCNRLEEPSSGSIRVEGIDVMAPGTTINAVRRRRGMVLQS